MLLPGPSLLFRNFFNFQFLTDFECFFLELDFLGFHLSWTDEINFNHLLFLCMNILKFQFHVVGFLSQYFLFQAVSSCRSHNIE